MSTDPVQHFLVFLYSYRIILGIVIFVSAVNGAATFAKSVRGINTSVSELIVWGSGVLFRKRRLHDDTLALIKEIKLSVSVTREKVAQQNRRSMMDYDNPQSALSSFVREVYKEKYLQLVEDLRKRFAGYNVSSTEFDDLHLSPLTSNDIERICVTLSEFTERLDLKNKSGARNRKNVTIDNSSKGQL